MFTTALSDVLICQPLIEKSKISTKVGQSKNSDNNTRCI
jgi:hypothetical protein